MSEKNSMVIHIMNHPPAYEAHTNNPRPKINWDTSNGSWVGITGSEWSDQLSSELLRVNNNYQHEVWQPDLRADKIYSHTFKNGLTHRLFPAYEKSKKVIFSPMMLTFFRDGDYNFIVHIAYPHFQGLNKEIIDSYGNKKIILTFHSETVLPLNYLFKFQRNPFKKLIHLKQHFLAKKYFKFIDHVTYQTDKNIKTLKKYYKGNMSKLTMGLNTSKFNFLDKTECRNNLMLPLDKRILLTVSRLNAGKNIHKLIAVLNTIDSDFIFIVVGHGSNEYEEYLHRKAKKLLYENKIRFEGVKTSKEINSYLNAADLFIHVSNSEAGPVAIMEAMACELPIFCTDTGNTAELLNKYNAGTIVGVKNYKEWKKKLIDFLHGEPIRVLDRGIVREQYDWENIAKSFIQIYSKCTYDN